MPLRLKVVLGIGGLLSLVGVCALIAVVLVLNLKNDQQKLNERHIPYANAIAEAALNAKGAANDERGYLITADPTFLTLMESRIRTARAAFATAKSTAQGAEQHRAAETAEAGFERWLVALRTHLETYKAGDRRGSTESALGPGRALRKRYEASLAEAEALADQAIHSGSTSVDDTASRSVTILIASLIAAIAIGIALAVWVVRLILHPVYAMLAFVDDTKPVSER